MSTTDESVTDESTETEAEEVEGSEQETESTDVVQDDPDAGAKKALIAERAARKTAEKELARIRVELADKDKPAEEQALEQARREAIAEVTQKANERIVRAELKTAATGKVKNPALALKLIDTSGIDVDDDGEPDSDAIDAAVADLIAQYPELAVETAKFSGTADQGAKGRASQPAQLTEADLERLVAAGDDDAIVQARAEGRLNRVLGIK